MRRLQWAVLVPALCVGCGARVPGQRVPSASEATGRDACITDEQGRASPLIVDLQPEQRSDIETASRRGLVVVRYDCEAFSVLPRCEAVGAYRYDGTAPKEQVVRMTTADEITATLPLAGIGIAADLEGELVRGMSLDLALIMVGKLTADRPVLSRDDLRGDCEGATHVLHTMTVGAFAFSTGRQSEARTAVQIFSAGTEVTHGEAKRVSVRDGSLASCAKATGADPAAPEGCSAALRVEVLPIHEPLPPMAIVDDELAQELRGQVCPDPVACEASCNAGDAIACRDWGILLSIGDQGVTRDLGRSTIAFQRACELNETLACTLIGLALITRGPRADAERGKRLLERACERGNAAACRGLGTAAQNGGDTSMARPYFERACKLGDQDGCREAGH